MILIMNVLRSMGIPTCFLDILLRKTTFVTSCLLSLAKKKKKKKKKKLPEMDSTLNGKKLLLWEQIFCSSGSKFFPLRHIEKRGKK